MGRWNRLVGGTLGVLLACGVLSGCGGSGGSGGIAYLNFDDKDTFGGVVIRGAFTQKAQADGLQVDYYDAKGDGNLQIDQFKEALAGGAKIVVLLPVDGDSIVPMVEQANEAGVPVISLNRDLNGGKHLEVGSDNYEAGKLQAEYMVKNLPQGAQVVYLEGSSNQKSAQERWEGFKKECLEKRPDVKLLSMQDGDYSKAEAMKITALWLTLFPKIDAVICGNDQMALGAVAALKAAHRLEGCQVSGIDATDEALKAVASGEMVQTVKQDGVGQAEGALKLVSDIQHGGNPSTGIMVPFVSITRENLAQFTK